MKIKILIILLVSTALNVFAQKDNITYDELDEKPHYKGGDEEFNKLLAENLRYPESAMEKGIDGTVIISFEIQPDGTISNIKFKNKVNKLLNEEAERIIQLTNGNWLPGKKDGDYVQSYYEEIVRFRLVDEKESSYYLKKAKRKFDKEKYKKAIPLLEKLISYEPYDFEYLMKLAKAYHETNQIEKSCAIIARLNFLKYESIDKEIAKRCEEGSE